MRSLRDIKGAKPGVPLNKAEKRLAKRLQAMESKSTAKSAAHEGVVERPMDKNLSKILEQRRAQAAGRGTSVGRLKKSWAEEQENLLATPNEEQQGSSVGRLKKPWEEEEEEEKKKRATSAARLLEDRLQLAKKIQPNDKPKSSYGDFA